MAQEIKDAMTILGILERGALGPALTTEIEQVVTHLNNIAADRGKAKGSLSLKLEFNVENGAVRVRSEFATKLPKLARPESLFFVTPSGGLSLEHPQQINLFPQEVSRTETA